MVPYAVMKKYIDQDQLRLKIEIKDDNPNGENKVKKEQTEKVIIFLNVFFREIIF